MEREKLPTDTYKGVRDFYPHDWAVLTHCFTTIRSVLRTYGYEEYNASPLERAELYEAKTSEEIVATQTYTFLDRGNRRVTLRPEMTPTIARMVAAKRRDLPMPVRWFSIPNVFRYERPQRGRLREHYQLNVDLIGSPNIADADREILLVAARIMQAFGATADDFIIRLSSRELLSAATSSLKLSPEQAAAYAALLDRKAKLPPADFERERAVFRRSGTDPLELIEAGSDTAVVAEKEKVDALIVTLASLGVTNVVYDPTIVRGFLYYTGMVFEVFDTNPENPRSLFGGGRFDGLVAAFGGEPLNAVGFGMGDVTLVDFLTTHNLLPDTISSAPTLYVAAPGEDTLATATTFAERLRTAGIAVLIGNCSKPIGDQVRDALKRSIPYFLVYGTDEATTGNVKLKKLADSTEQTLSETELIAQLS